MVSVGVLNVPYMLEKPVYMFSPGLGVECFVNVRLFWLIGLFRSPIPLLIFLSTCFIDY